MPFLSTFERKNKKSDFRPFLHRRLKKCHESHYIILVSSWPMPCLTHGVSDDPQIPQKPVQKHFFVTFFDHFLDALIILSEDVKMDKIDSRIELRRWPQLTKSVKRRKTAQKPLKKVSKVTFSGLMIVFSNLMYLAAWNKNTTFGLLAHSGQNGPPKWHCFTIFRRKPCIK